ncbi:MAG TPA: hypothetical protein VGO18_06355, partial [Steroidobacteraceae bacterium]|nr:hypothetical protein [Steroidobacteraceae bacterium]
RASLVTELEAIEAGDHCGGTRASGRVKFGPTEQPNDRAATATISSRAGLDVLVAIILTLR